MSRNGSEDRDQWQRDSSRPDPVDAAKSSIQAFLDGSGSYLFGALALFLIGAFLYWCIKGGV